MIKGTALILIATMAVYQYISAKSVLCIFWVLYQRPVFHILQAAKLHIPRPLGRGEPAGFRNSG